MLPCGTNFLWVLSFAIFGIFPAICKNNFPRIKITSTEFTPEKIFSNLNSPHNAGPRNRVCSLKTCLFRSETNKAVYNEILAHNTVLFENMYSYCTYSIKTKILSMLGTGYSMKIAKINSQQEKPICPNGKLN